VEDDDTSRRILAQLLRRLGYEIETAATLKEGLEKLGAWNPACVILDLMLPDGSGTAILARIRDQRLPVRVAVASGAYGSMIANAQSLFPDAYFPKPIDLGRLRDWLARVN
jgi:two-component system nitrogen regulation response regulator GlnG